MRIFHLNDCWKWDKYFQICYVWNSLSEIETISDKINEIIEH